MELYDRIKELERRIKYLAEHPNEVDESEGMTKRYSQSHCLSWLKSELEEHRQVAEYYQKHRSMK